MAHQDDGTIVSLKRNTFQIVSVKHWAMLRSLYWYESILILKRALGLQKHVCVSWLFKFLSN